MKELSLDGRTLSKALGVSGASVSDWKAGKQPIKRLTGLALQALYGVSCDWVIDGKGSMWIGRSDTETSNALIEIPHLERSALWGFAGETPEPDGCRKTAFPQALLHSLLEESGAGTVSDLYTVECVGETMRPTVHGGDMLLINTALPLRIKPKQGGLFLVRREPEGCDTKIKRVRVNGSLNLISDAPGYSVVEIEINGLPIQSLVLGRVCWIGRAVLLDERPAINW